MLTEPIHTRQLLLDIHLLSLSSALPFVSRHLHSLFSNSSAHHRAQYLAAAHPRSTLQHAVRYPICSLPVVHALERIKSLWDNRPGHALRCPELPKRLLKGLGATSPAAAEVWRSRHLPMIEYLFDRYGSSANSGKGYFLSRAVLARNRPFIELLLAHDADPALNQGYAVNLAIGTGDLGLVKLLMEKEVHTRPKDEDVDTTEQGGKKGKKKRRRESDGGGGGKRRKTEDRCKATSKMLEVAMKEENWEIVTYLQSKGKSGLTT